MRRLLACLLLTTGCAVSHPVDDASQIDAPVSPDAGIVCTTIARPTGSCDPANGICCTDSVCVDGICSYVPDDCSGDLGPCVVREDCCNARHSCIEGVCQY